ncbi:MAG: hypothetical protein ACI9YU_000569 [Flavobacteriales bacterium]
MFRQLTKIDNLVKRWKTIDESCALFDQQQRKSESIFMIVPYYKTKAFIPLSE